MVRSDAPVGDPRVDHAAVLTAITEIMQTVGRLAPLRETLNSLAERVSVEMGFRCAAILLPDEPGRQMRIEGSYGMATEYVRAINSRSPLRMNSGMWAGSPTARAYQTGTTTVSTDVRTDPSLAPWRRLADEQGYRSIASVPLMLQGKPIGVLNCYSASVRNFMPLELELLEAVAVQAAIAAALSRRMEQQQGTIRALHEATDSLMRQRALMERSQEIDQELLGVALTQRGLPEVVVTLARLVGNPVYIWDQFQNLLCSAGPGGELSRGDGPDERLSLPLPGTGMTRTVQDIRLLLPTNQLAKLVIAPVVVGEANLGVMGILERDRLLGELDRRALQQAAVVVALEMLREQSVVHTEMRLRADFLHDLVEGRVRDGEDTLTRGRMQGVDLTRTHRVLVIDVDDFGGFVAAREEHEIARLRTDLLQAVRGALGDASGSLLTMVSDRITLLHPVPSTTEPRPELRLADLIREKVAKTVTGLTVSIGIGGSADQPSALPGSYQEAVECLALLRRTGSRGQALALDDLGVFKTFLFNVRNPEMLLTDARRVLGRIAEQKRPRERQLLATLVAYLNNACELETTARSLFIHPNTLKYRLHSIEEATGLDLHCPFDLLQMAMAVTAISILSPSDQTPDGIPFRMRRQKTSV